jgi:hypothetical protein
MKPSIIALTAAFLATAWPVVAADYSDPTWPCIQRKVENLSAGLMWSLPTQDATSPVGDALTADIRALAGTLSLRRIPLEDTKPQIEAFAARHNGDAEVLGQVFTAVFKPLNTRRSRIISGIGDFSLSQITLAAQIDSTRVELEAQTDKDDPDFDRIDLLEEQLDWDQIIFSDRQRSIQYLCETPVIIEQRLFEIARMLQQAATK